jgi:hypothetical protein
MKKTFTLTLTFTLILPTILGLATVNLAIANPIGYTYVPTITITRDGSITPPTDIIRRNGNVYTLTGDIKECSVVIMCSNIFFDGAGHTINITKGDNHALMLRNLSNSTVKNLNIICRFDSVVISFSSNCTLSGVTSENFAKIIGDNNVVAESTVPIDMARGRNNLIVRNNISDLFISMDGTNSNTFSQNNIIRNQIDEWYKVLIGEIPDFCPSSANANSWDNGSVGNYWGDYMTKYPNASEMSNTGIGNTPRIIDAVNVDRFPLVYPWGTPELAIFGLDNATYSQNYPLNFTVNKPTKWIGYSLDGITNVTVSGNMTLNGIALGFHNLTVYATDVYGVVGSSKTVYFTVVESFPTALITGGSAALIVGVAVCLFYHRKKHNSQ